MEGYGLTESIDGHSGDAPGRGHQNRLTGLPLPDVEVRIVDMERGERELAAGKPGEVLMRAPQLMAGYWRNPAETTMRPRRLAPRVTSVSWTQTATYSS